MTFDRPGTGPGMDREVVDPSPSWPSMFPPQAHTVPSRLSATLKPAPAAVSTTSEMETKTGADFPNPALPSPNCPSALLPHAQTAPSLVTARTCSAPAETDLMSERPVITPG